MNLQQAAAGLNPARIPEGETFTYCAECGSQIGLQPNGEPFYINLQRLPICEGCAITPTVH